MSLIKQHSDRVDDFHNALGYLFYFSELQNNILEKATEVFGVYLEGGNHWSFFVSKPF